MSDLVPCLLERRIVPKVWGGRALERVLGIPLPAGEKVGESWEVFDRPDGSSALRGQDATLRDLMAGDRGALLGDADATREGRFPLAIKFLDAAEALSVQVHPDDAQAREEGDSGKSEAWVVVHAGPKARVARGVRAGVSPERFREVAGSERVLEVLQTFAPRAGDCVRVPPGTVHTLGPDVVVLEVQRNSDVTYRLFDWGRRPDHTFEKALRAVSFAEDRETVVTPEPLAGGGESLVRDPRFVVQRHSLDHPRSFATGGSFKILTFLSGMAMLGWKSQGRHDPLRVQKADSVLIPACVPDVFLSPVGPACVIVSGPGAGR
jgi:mannose-6-phosphate isomerase